MTKCYEMYGSMDSVDRIINEEEGRKKFHILLRQEAID